MKELCDFRPGLIIRALPHGKKATFRYSETDGSIAFLDGEMMGGFDLVQVEPDLWMADNIEAADGWGPFLLDLGMEWAFESGGWVFPHPTSVSDDAWAVFDYYYTKRSDVRNALLPPAILQKCEPVHKDPALLSKYQKAPTFLPQLRGQGKLMVKPL